MNDEDIPQNIQDQIAKMRRNMATMTTMRPTEPKINGKVLLNAIKKGDVHSIGDVRNILEAAITRKKPATPSAEALVDFTGNGDSVNQAILNKHAELVSKNPEQARAVESSAINMHMTEEAVKTGLNLDINTRFIKTQQYHSNSQLKQDAIVAYYKRGKDFNQGKDLGADSSNQLAMYSPNQTLRTLTPKLDSLPEEQRDAVNWYAYMKFKEINNALTSNRTFDSATAAKLRGMTKEQLESKYETELAANYANPTLKQKVSIMQQVVDGNPINIPAYQKWRADYIEGSMSPSFLTIAVSEYQDAQRREIAAKTKFSGKTPEEPFALRKDNPEVMALRDGRILASLMPQDRDKLIEYLAATTGRNQCDWKGGEYYNKDQPNPTTLKSCLPPVKATASARL